MAAVVGYCNHEEEDSMSEEDGDVDGSPLVGSDRDVSDEEDGDGEVGSFNSRQYRQQSYRETTDTYTIAASPSFGYLGPSSASKNSIFDGGQFSGLGSDLKLPLLSSEKIESAKNLLKPVIISSLTDQKLLALHWKHAEVVPVSQGCSVTQTVFNGVNVLAGVGLLSAPFTNNEAGWAGLVVLAFFAVVCCYTGVLPKRCFESKDGVSTYPDIGEGERLPLEELVAFSFL